MKNACTLLRIAVSPVIATLALASSARADEPEAAHARFEHAALEPTRQSRPAGREPRREAGIGLTVSALAIETGGAAPIGGLAEPASGASEEIEYSLPGLMMAATSVPLVLIGVPLWASREGAELGLTEVDLGVGLSAVALRGSF